MKRAGDEKQNSSSVGAKQLKPDDTTTLSNGKKYEWSQTEHSLSLIIRSSGGRNKVSIDDGYISVTTQGDAEPWLLQKLADGVSEQLGGSSSSSGPEGRVEEFSFSKKQAGTALPQLLQGELTAEELRAYRAQAAKKAHIPQALRTFLDLWGPELKITVSDISVSNKVSGIYGSSASSSSQPPTAQRSLNTTGSLLRHRRCVARRVGVQSGRAPGRLRR